jgi:hypothetical protein
MKRLLSLLQFVKAGKVSTLHKLAFYLSIIRIPMLVPVMLLILLFQANVKAQQQPLDSACAQRDIQDVISKWRDKPANTDVVKTNSILLIPTIGSNPATGFAVGVGGQYAFKMPESRKYSMINGSFQYTSKNQYVLMLKNSIYSKKEKIFFTGDWRFLIYSQSTYGLGTDSPKGGILDYQYNLGGVETAIDSLAQPMNYNFLRVYQTMTFKLKDAVYLGFGYNYDGYYDIKDQKLRLNPGDSLITSHYAYSTYYGFSTEKYYSSTINATLIIDKRDNMIQPHKGYFLKLDCRGAFQILGSLKDAFMFLGEWRSFHNVSKKNPAHLVAFWALADLTQGGNLPYMTLPATAYDQRGRSARGYTQGRFRGNNYIYGETEYRFPISRCGGIFSGVVFLNATTTNNEATDLKLFESVKPGYGFGLRVMVDKNSRTNFVLDYGFGEKSSGLYLTVSETF